MKDWFEALDTRERIVVAAGAVIVVIALIYSLAWQPLDKRYVALQNDVENWQRSLADLRPLRAQPASAGQTQSTRPTSSQQTPIIIVDTTLRGRGLDRYRRRSQPTAGNGIRVEFENVAFDELVLWLGDLSEQYGMHVEAGSFSVGTQVAPGRINATLTLERVL